MKNILLFHAPNSLFTKLIKGITNSITSEEIKNYFNVVDKKFKTKIIDYCYTDATFKFLYQNNYKFNEEEFSILENATPKKIFYEKYLLMYKNMHKNSVIIDKKKMPFNIPNHI